MVNNLNDNMETIHMLIAYGARLIATSAHAFSNSYYLN